MDDASKTGLNKKNNTSLSTKIDHGAQTIILLFIILIVVFLYF